MNERREISAAMRARQRTIVRHVGRMFDLDEKQQTSDGCDFLINLIGGVFGPGMYCDEDVELVLEQIRVAIEQGRAAASLEARECEGTA